MKTRKMERIVIYETGISVLSSVFTGKLGLKQMHENRMRSEPYKLCKIRKMKNLSKAIPQ